MRFTLVVYVSHKVNVLVTDIILNITSQENLIFTSLHIGSRIFELFSKEVRVKKQPGMPLSERVGRPQGGVNLPEPLITPQCQLNGDGMDWYALQQIQTAPYFCIIGRNTELVLRVYSHVQNLQGMLNLNNSYINFPILSPTFLSIHVLLRRLCIYGRHNEKAGQITTRVPCILLSFAIAHRCHNFRFSIF